MHCTPAGGKDSKGISDGAIAAILGPLIVAVGVLALGLVLLLVRQRRRNRDLFGRMRAPRPGPDTSLLISDIQNSTRLWWVRVGAAPFVEWLGGWPAALI